MENENINLEEKFRTLPSNIQKALTSPEFAQSIKTIGASYSLNADQQSVLFDKIADVLFGILESSDFTNSLSSEADLDEKTAKSITEKINSQVLSSLKLSAPTAEDETSSTEAIAKEQTSLSALEKAGNFEIERTVPINTPGASPVTAKDRINLLAGVENPPPVKFRTSAQPTKTEPLVDQLLKAPTAIPAEKIRREPEKAPEKPAGTDLYREPLI